MILFSIALWVNVVIPFLLFGSVLATQIQSLPANNTPAPSTNQGKCPTFVKECYKTCFSLRQVLVAYTCSLNNGQGQYTARCICGGTNDQTQVVLSKAQIPAAVTTTLQTIQTKDVLITATSIASTITTATATIQASACSPTTITSTILSTSTLTASLVTVTSQVTSTSVTTTTSVYGIPSGVVAAVVSTGGTGSGKRALSSFCPDIQLACKIGCAAVWSSASANICQAIPWSSKYSIACVCKNNVNVVQQVIQAYNLVRALGNRCTQISATTIAATATSTIVAVSTVLVSQTTLVVPTTVVSVATNTITKTQTFACPTTLTTVQPVTATESPTTTTTAIVSTTTLTSVVVASPTVYYVAYSASASAAPTYIASNSDSDDNAPTYDTASAQAFVVVPSGQNDGIVNLLGIGGAFSEKYLSSTFFTRGDYYGNVYSFYRLADSPLQGKYTNPDSNQDYYSNIWQVDPSSLVLTLGNSQAGYQTVYDVSYTRLETSNNVNAGNSDTSGLHWVLVSAKLVPA